MNSTPQVYVKDGIIGVRLNGIYKSIGNTIHLGGYHRITGIIFKQVNECGEECLSEKYASEIIRNEGLDPRETALFLTAAELPKWSSVSRTSLYEGFLLTIVTAGFKPLACVGGNEGDSNAGTINIAVVVDECLSDAAAIELVSMASSAKTAAIGDLLLGCGAGKGRAYATGTDSVLIAYRDCVGERFAGPLTNIGRAVFTQIYSDIHRIAENISFEKRFQHITGITIEELLDIGVEFYIKAPVPGVSVEEARDVLMRIVLDVLKDPNVWQLIMASRSLDDLGLAGSIPYLSRKDYLADYKGIVADELLGITLSMYLNGWKGLFAYYWIDRIKDKDKLPGSLPMFMDDIIGALLGGSLSKLYDHYLTQGKGS